MLFYLILLVAPEDAALLLCTLFIVNMSFKRSALHDSMLLSFCYRSFVSNPLSCFDNSFKFTHKIVLDKAMSYCFPYNTIIRARNSHYVFKNAQFIFKSERFI
jgi:hypothetical protein